MTLTTLKDEIKAFGREKYSYVKGYIEMEENLKEKMSQGLMYQSEVEQRLGDYKREKELASKQKVDEIALRIDKEYEKELAALEDKIESVTADDVAELTLLASTKVSKEELESYFKKYQSKPLAIKKLKELAGQSPELQMIDFGKFETEQRLYNLIMFFKQQLYSFDGFYTITGDKIQVVQFDMIINRDITTLDERLNEYLQK